MLDKQQIEIKESVEARKVAIADDDAWNILKDADEIVVSRGKKYQILDPADENKGEILSLCLGRTGSLRAPTLRIGKRYIVGFNEEMYKLYIK